MINAWRHPRPSASSYGATLKSPLPHTIAVKGCAAVNPHPKSNEHKHVQCSRTYGCVVQHNGAPRSCLGTMELCHSSCNCCHFLSWLRQRIDVHQLATDFLDAYKSHIAIYESISHLSSTHYMYLYTVLSSPTVYQVPVSNMPLGNMQEGRRLAKVHTQRVRVRGTSRGTGTFTLHQVPSRYGTVHNYIPNTCRNKYWSWYWSTQLPIGRIWDIAANMYI